MKTLIEHINESHDVKLHKTFRTRDGIRFYLVTLDDLERDKDRIFIDLTDYDMTLAKVHTSNCSYVIVNQQYNEIIDDEYLLDEIYSMIERGKCR